MILSCRCIGIPTVKYEVLHTEIKPPKPLIVNSELTLHCWQDVKIQELTCIVMLVKNRLYLMKQCWNSQYLYALCAPDHCRWCGDGRWRRRWMDCGEKRREKKIAVHMSIRFVTLTSHYLVFLGINVSVTLLSVSWCCHLSLDIYIYRQEGLMVHIWHTWRTVGLCDDQLIYVLQTSFRHCQTAP